MVSFTLSSIQPGWVQAHIASVGNEVVITASNTPNDSIRDFVDAVARLQSASSSECRWIQEPGEVRWVFVRSDENVSVEVIQGDVVSATGWHRGTQTTLFHDQTEWLDFSTQVLASMLQLRNSLGLDGYKREWGHPFPQEACDQLESAIQRMLHP
jgi:hypothetical protein